MERDEFLESVAKETLEKILKDNPSCKNSGIKVFVDYSKENPEIKLVVPGSVKMITSYMFDHLKRVNSVDIQEGIQTIMSNAFDTCDSIREIHLPESLVQIQSLAFANCINLEKINFPNNLLQIDSEAFYQCGQLKEIKLPDSLEDLGPGAFALCKRLERVELPDSIIDLKNSTFQNCYNLKEIKLPSNLAKIESSCFHKCRSLENIELPDTVKEIGQYAFEHCEKLKKIKLPKNIEKIWIEAFAECALEEIVLPSTMQFLDRKAFADCVNLKKVLYEYEDGKYFTLSKELYDEGLDSDEFRGLRNFLKVRDKIGAKFIPAKQIFTNTPENMIENFYKHSKLWAEVFNKFAQSNGTTMKAILPQVKEDFYKICFVSGLFQDDYKVRMQAKEFIETKIIGKFGQYPLHERFTGLNIYANGFNPNFAEFFIKNFGPDFLIKQTYDEDLKNINYFAQAYNNFSEIEKAYPNKVVTTNTDNDRLTEEDIYKVISNVTYNGIETEQDQVLAELCNLYGYSQEDFKQLQDYMHEGERIKNEGLENLFCLPDEVSSKNVITYRFLEKGDPLGGLLGEITNCCQTIHSAASSCCRHGMTNPNGGFVVFELEGKIIGQSWVWYDKQSEKICLDNVEVPRSAKNKAVTEKSDFKNCLKRLSKNFKTAMKEKGRNVSYVTMGAGYNDILDVINKNFKKVNATLTLANAAIQQGGHQTRLQGHAPDLTYTDINQGEYILE